jgi:hypothetical protein
MALGKVGRLIMEPMKRRPNIEKLLNEVFGTVSAVRANRCVDKPVGCGREIPPNEFGAEYWTELARREYTMSGLCNRCQDEVFAGDDDGDMEEWE